MERQTTLGQRLKQVMEERGLSYDALGRLLEMRPQTLNRYVLDQREPKAQVAVEMAARLEVDPLWLIGYDAAKTPGESNWPGFVVPVYDSLTGEEPVDWTVADESGWFLRMPDESCAGAGIRAGDLVLLRGQQTAESGQLAACQVGEEAPELVRYTRQGDIVILQPERSGAQPRILTAADFMGGNARILAVAVRLVRDL